MSINLTDVPLIEAELRHRLMPSPESRRALDLARKAHPSFRESGKQEVGPGRAEQGIPADDLASSEWQR